MQSHRMKKYRLVKTQEQVIVRRSRHTEQQLDFTKQTSNFETVKTYRYYFLLCHSGNNNSVVVTLHTVNSLNTILHVAWKTTAIFFITVIKLSSDQYLLNFKRLKLKPSFRQKTWPAL